METLVDIYLMEQTSCKINEFEPIFANQATHNDAFFVLGARLSSHQLAHHQASTKVPPVLQLICVMVPNQPELCVRVAFCFTITICTLGGLV